MKKKTLAIASMAMILVASMSIKPAMAYFTATQEAEAKIAIEIGDSELETEDSVTDMVKTISVKNTSSFEAYIRVKAIVASNCKVTQKDSPNWELKDDGYYYFKNVVAAGESTDSLSLAIETSSNEDFNVVIIEESTKVHYDENGNPYADWTYTLENEQREVTE